MARVKICPKCEHRNHSGAWTCRECTTDIADVDPVDDADASALGDGPSPESGRPVAGTSLEGISGGARAALEFPWGPVEVRDRLNVGRDPKFSPLAAQIESESEDYVSGRHAELYLDDEGYLFVVDVGTYGRGSKNGTYVNGRKIEPLQPFQLFDGNEIGFSHHLMATVRLG